ncbi:hypothetical protein KM043_017110 [Ampulex compressa]|nr:hypothetical protein KM043_017110 [Ampulex compressa]
MGNPMGIRRNAMSSRNAFSNAPWIFLLPPLLLLLTPACETSNAFELSELQTLAALLKPEECTRFVSVNPNCVTSKAQRRRQSDRQDCFQKLMKWICHKKTSNRNTRSVVMDRLRDIGRGDLIACLPVFSATPSASQKVVRAAQSVSEYDDYDGTTVPAGAKSQNKNTKDSGTQKDDAAQSNKTKAGIFSNGYTYVKLSLRTAGIIVLSTILLTCCCTLFIRSKLTKLCSGFRGKKKKSKFIPVDGDDERAVPRRGLSLKKSRKKRKRMPSYDMVHASTQDSATTEVREPEEPPPTGCYKCYKKKRKKAGKKSRK